MSSMCADHASLFQILGCILAAESARISQQGADDVDGIRLKTGRTTETEAFDGLCVRQGIRLLLRNQVTCPANQVDRLVTALRLHLTHHAALRDCGQVTPVRSMNGAGSVLSAGRRT